VRTTLPPVPLYSGGTTTPVETTGYDSEGNVATTTDATGATTVSSYDPLGRQVSTTNPVAGTTLTTYNATEQAAQQDAAGNVTRSGYDGAGRLVLSSDALTGTVQYGYDAAGNTLAITTGDTTGAVISTEARVYDALNRVTRDTTSGPGTGGTAQTTTTAYDQDGHAIQTQAPNGTLTLTQYDLAGDPVETDEQAGGATTLYAKTSYDAAGNAVQSTDADGRTTTTTYDPDNRVVQTVSTAGTSTVTTGYSYDPDGNTLSTTTTDGAGTHTQTATYDAEDRQTSGTDDGATTTYGYDAAGQRRTETLPGGATTLTTGLDPAGRTTALTDTTSGVGAATSLFGYNANDQPVTRTLPGGTGVRETTTYDANGRVTSVVANGPGGTAQTAQTTQTAQARMQARSALATQARYGVNVGALALVNPTLSSRYALGYDAASRVNSSTTLSGTDALAYDPQNRLTDESGPQVIAGSGAYHWTYDQNNNLRTATDDQIGVTDVYTYGNPARPDQQTAGGASNGGAAYVLSYGYDGAGHTTSIVNPVGQGVPLSGPSQGDPKAMHTTFSYDAQGRLTQEVYLERAPATGATTALTPTTVLMSYNALGQRAHYTISAAGATTTDYHFTYRDGKLGQAIVTSGGQPLYTNTYLYDGQGQPWELIRTDGGGTTTRYGYVLDALGDVVALTDANGSVVDRYAYDSWGEQISNDRTDETIPQQLRYRGQYYDEKLGTYWMGDGRQYDPESARYLQPVGDPSFVYANDDPLAMGGPDGYCGPIASTYVACHSTQGQAVVTHAIYMFLIGSDQGILESDAPFISKALAVVDIASNVTLIIPIEGEVNRLAVKGGVLELEKLVARGARGAAYRYRIGHPVEQITRTIAHYTNRESYFYDVAKKYGINLRGIKIVFDPDLPPGRYGLTTAAEGGRVIHVGPDAFASDATAANTIAHELNHARDLIANGGRFRGDEETAQAAGDALQSYIEGRR